MSKSSSEIKDLIKKAQEKNSWTMLDLSKNLGVTEAALSRWNNGRSFPHGRNLEKLKALAEGKSAPQNVANVENQNTVLIGHINQLTTQIQMLQMSFGELKGQTGEQVRQISEDVKEIKKSFFQRAEIKRPQ